MGFISRYRHGRGFGIHSPFAYRLIREVLNEKGVYYDYERLHGKRERLLYRLGSRFTPVNIAAIGAVDLRPLQMACHKARETEPRDADFLLVEGSSAMDAVLRDAIDRGALIFITGHHKKLMKDIKAYMKEKGFGMTFDNHHGKALVAPFKKLPRQDFGVRF